MLKYLVVIGVIAFVYYFFIKKKPIQNNSSNDNSKANDMIECANCGTYCEINDAILSNGKYYCSSECAKNS